MNDKQRDKHLDAIEKNVVTLSKRARKLLGDYIEQNFVEKPKVTNEQAMDFLAKIYGWERNNSSRDKEQQKSTTMSKEEYKQLESLLGKLQTEFGYPYCIVPHVVQDGYNIGIYEKEGDRPLKFSETWYSIEGAVKSIKKRLSNE